LNPEPTEHPESAWYLLYTKPKHEDAVATRLSEAGFEVMNPKLKERRYYRRKLQDVISPLFPCYLFVRMRYDRDGRMVRYTRGVKRVVGTQEAPIVVDDAMVQTISERLNPDGVAALPQVAFAEGDVVLIQQGPMAGLEGVFLKPMKSTERVTVLLSALNARVQVDRLFLSKA